MKMVHLENLDYRNFEAAVKEHRHKIIDVLQEWGPCTPEVLRYFLQQQYGLVINTVTLEQFTIVIEPGMQPIMHNDFYYLPGQEGQVPRIPLQNDYALAYVVLHRRLQAIRENPDLLDLSDEYIDDLYAPKRKETAQ